MSSRIHKTVRLSRSRRWQLYIIGIGVWLSGGLWLLFHYFLGKQGDFGPVENPLTPWWLRLHGAFAFASIGILGLLWGTHITVAWPSSQRRWSGGVLAGVFAVLIVTGYLLYYIGSDTVRPVISIVHWGIGLGSPAFLILHRLRLRCGRATNGNTRFRKLRSNDNQQPIPRKPNNAAYLGIPFVVASVEAPDSHPFGFHNTSRPRRAGLAGDRSFGKPKSGSTPPWFRSRDS